MFCRIHKILTKLVMHKFNISWIGMVAVLALRSMSQIQLEYSNWLGFSCQPKFYDPTDQFFSLYDIKDANNITKIGIHISVGTL